MEPAEDGARWRFGEAVLDERTMELHVGGQKVELAKKPLELLMFFVRNPGEVLTKDELFEAVWAGRIVSEASLTNAIGRLRTALGDESSQQLIKAVYGYGYRFMGEVVREDGPVHTLPPPAPFLAFMTGDAVPMRAGWVLYQRLGAGGGGDAWLGQELTTHDTRVFKFARDHAALSALKREITLSRLMRESLGERPDFVRVLDWNLDEAPFFIAIDHCSEGSLSDWAGAHGGIAAMPLPQRLELLAQAAEALAAAHSVGVLHKDIKPSNLLLHKSVRTSGQLQIKLADFGSARLLDRSRLTALNIAQLGFTQTVLDGSTGTPLYLAPELLAGSPPTIRSDIYALGVVLYQLVAGDLRLPLTAGWERKIEDPLLIEDITAAAAGDPQNRLADAAALAQRLRALPTRREARERAMAARQQAEQFQAALDRSRARRSLWMALAAVAVIGMSLSLWQFWGARAAARESAAVAAFLVDDMLVAADPMQSSGGELTVKAMLDQAAARLASRLGDQLRVRASIGLGLAKAYHQSGHYDDEIKQLDLAQKDAEAIEGPDGETVLKIVSQRGDALQGLTQFARAGEMYQRVLDSSGRLGQNHEAVLTALDGLGFVAFREGRFDEAASRYEAYLKQVTALGDMQRIIDTEYHLTRVYAAQSRYAEAEAQCRKAIEGQSRLVEATSPKVELMRVTLGDVLGSAGRLQEADEILQQAGASLAISLGPEHPFTLAALYYRARGLLQGGDATQALPLLERIHALRLKNQGEDNVSTQLAALMRGRALTALGRQKEALPILQKALAVLEAKLPPTHPNVTAAREALAAAQGR